MKNGLRRGWSVATIGELIGSNGIFVDGDWIETKDQDPSGDVRLIQLADIGDGGYRNKSHRYLTSKKAAELGCTFLQPGDVLIARMPDPLGRACVFPGDKKPSVTAVDVCIVRIGDSGVSNKWLMHTINSAETRSAVAGLQSGSTRKRISRSNLATIKLPIPPVPEQKRIVAKIERLFTQLDAGIEELRKAQAQLKRYRQAVFKAAVTGELTKEWRESYNHELEPASELLARILQERRAKWEADQLAKMEVAGKYPENDDWKRKYKEPVEVEADGTSQLPREWSWINFDHILTKIEAGKSFKCEERPPRSSETGVVKVSAVTWGEFNEDESKTCLDKEQFNDGLLIQTGDFLFSRANTIELVGACVIVRTIQKRLMLSDKILRFRTIIVAPPWLLLCLRSYQGRADIERLSTGNQESMRNIGQDRIRRIRIPLPPLREIEAALQETARVFSNIDALERMVQESLKQAERMRQAILKQAFEGKLVPQDPNDEPTELLLERIKLERAKREAERAAIKKTPGKRSAKPRNKRAQKVAA